MAGVRNLGDARVWQGGHQFLNHWIPQFQYLRNKGNLWNKIYKLGGLDSQDQLKLLKLADVILAVETRLFFFSVKIFKVETFESKLSYVKIFIKTLRDFQDLLTLFEIYRDILPLSRLFEGLQVQKSWQIKKSWSRKMIKSANSQ